MLLMIGAIILSAGESKRMGKPKALLEFRVSVEQASRLSTTKTGETPVLPEGRLKSPLPQTLLTRQANLLNEVKCKPIVVVLGFDANTIIHSHPHLEVSWCVNQNWKMGQFSSLQSGISHILNLNPPTPPFEKGGLGGIFILPIDAAGIKKATLMNIIREINKNPLSSATIPTFNGKGGHPVYISRALCQKIAEMNPAKEEARLDILLRQTPDVMHLSVNDEAIIKNINTLDEWRFFIQDSA